MKWKLIILLAVILMIDVAYAQSVSVKSADSNGAKIDYKGTITKFLYNNSIVTAQGAVTEATIKIPQNARIVTGKPKVMVRDDLCKPTFITAGKQLISLNTCWTEANIPIWLDKGYYNFKVSHFSSYFINGSGEFNTLAACLKYINNSNNNCSITGADTSYAIHKWLTNTSSLDNRQNISIAFDFDVQKVSGEYTNDDSDQNNNGNVSDAVWNATSYHGGGYDFNGTNYINVSENFTFDSQTFTVTMWIKSEAGVQGSAFGVGQDGVNRLQAHLPWNDHTLYFDVGETGRMTADYTAYEGKWTFVALAKDTTSQYIYLNGILKAIAGASPITAKQGLTIGCANMAGNLYCMHGSIDQFRIYNKTLNKTEIEMLYAGDIGKYNLSGDAIIFTNNTYSGGGDFLTSYSPLNYTNNDGNNVNYSTCVQFRNNAGAGIITVSSNDTKITHATGSNNYDVYLYSEDSSAVLGCGAYANITLFVDSAYALDCPTLEAGYGGDCALKWSSVFTGTGATSNYTWDTNINATPIREIAVNLPYLRFNATSKLRTGNNTLNLNGSELMGNNQGIGIYVLNSNNTIRGAILSNWTTALNLTFDDNTIFLNHFYSNVNDTGNNNVFCNGTEGNFWWEGLTPHTGDCGPVNITTTYFIDECSNNTVRWKKQSSMLPINYSVFYYDSGWKFLNTTISLSFVVGNYANDTIKVMSNDGNRNGTSSIKELPSNSTLSLYPRSYDWIRPTQNQICEV